MATQGAIAKLQAMLRECLVQIDGDGHQGGGSGFFAAPGYVLTCAHVVNRAAGRPISGSWQGSDWSGQVLFLSPPRTGTPGGGDPEGPHDDADSGMWPVPDIAVLKLDSDLMHPCARLAERNPELGTQMWAVGRRAQLGGTPGDFPTAELRYPGLYARSQGDLMRLVGDRLGPGMSGGPVLNLATGEVCGILKMANTDWDSYALPLRYLREALPADLEQSIRREHDLFHDRERHWVIAQEPLWREQTADMQNYGLQSSAAPLLEPAEEAELLGLIARVSGDGHPYQLYDEAVGDGLHPEPGELRDLRDVAFRLGDHPYEQRRLHPLIAFADLLAVEESHADPGLGAALRDWATAVAARHHTRPQLTTRRHQGRRTAALRARADGPTAGAEMMSVIAQVEPSGQAPDRYLLTVWLYRVSDNISVFLRDETPYSRTQVMGTLKLRLPEALGRLAGPATVIEFILPLGLFDEPFEQWQIFRRVYPRQGEGEQPIRSYAKLGYRYPIVLRDLERFCDEESRNHARPRWAWLRGLTSGIPLEWADCEQTCDGEEMYRWFEASSRRAALGIPGPANENPGEVTLDVAMSAGVPVALWRRTRCTDHHAAPPDGCSGKRFKNLVDLGLVSTTLDGLPQKVRDLRNTTLLTDEPASIDGRDLVVLWDNPDRGPRPRQLREP